MGKSKKPKPTGFEEFYADPPLTPGEYIEETENIYHPDNPFHDRIQICIQRFRARRKLDEKRGNILTKYLTLGGVDASPKQFTGGALDEETLANATAEEIAALQATDFVRGGGGGALGLNRKYYDPSEADGWVVDFEGVAKCFFSYRVPVLAQDDQDMIKLCSKVILSFLAYLLQHEVCKEYTADIMAAKKVCVVAEKELLAIQQLQQLLPGKFNMALSTLFGGQYEAFCAPDEPWDDGNMADTGNIALDKKTAREIFEKGAKFLSARGATFNQISTLVSVEQRNFEVVKSSTSEDILVPVKCKYWEGPILDEPDMPEEIPAGEQTFWLEPAIAKLLLPGMKLEVALCELDNGYRFFDVAGVFCSFYTYLENEKMLDWKEPVLSTRAGPTEDNPDAEDYMEGDFDDIKDD